MLRVVGDLVRLVHSQNRGALFGLFQDSAVLFGIVSIGVIGLIVWYHGHAGRSTLMSVALGLLLGGALGNMIDRLRLGYVVDFVDLGIGDLRWYTFNVADSAISLAIVLLLASAFLPARSSVGSNPDEAADARNGDAADARKTDAADAPKGEGADA
jgi:signal peptidase II